MRHEESGISGISEIELLAVMTDHRQKLHESLVAWAQIIQATTERRLAKAVLVAVLNTSSIGGAFSGWLLAISGATIGLAFSDVESLLNVLSPGELRLVFGFLFASCTAGFFARIAGSYVDLYRQMSTELEAAIEAILKEHDIVEEEIEKTAGGMVEPPTLAPDFQRAVAAFVASLPPFMRSRALKGVERGQADPLFIYKRAVNIYLLQGAMVVVQAILFGLFVATIFWIV